MHSNLYLNVEHRRTAKPAGPWSLLFRLADTGAAPNLHAFLSGGQTDDSYDGDWLDPRGLPEDVADASIQDDAFTVEDQFADSPVLDAVDDLRICTQEEAKRWVSEGRSRFLRHGYMVTDPEAFAQSWLGADELSELVALLEENEAENLYVIRSVQAAASSLVESGFDVRLVYWFS